MNLSSISKISNGSVVSGIDKRANVKRTDIEGVRNRSRIELNISPERRMRRHESEAIRK